MIWVNFLPWRRQRQRQQLRRDALLLVGLLALFLAAATPLLKQQALSKRQQVELHWLQETNGQLNRLGAHLARLESQRDALRRTLAVSEARQARLRTWHDFTRDLADTLPMALWLSEISTTAQSLIVTGFCLQLTEAEAFRQQLQRFHLFQQVKTSRISRDGKGIIHFTLEASLPEQEHE
ncbi:PilN domain-containing protein [Erwinia sp.]|uniref:PilN domain-containing protein n=1 Tax=Erwinia citreus TaxID=558 RepID=UPI002897606D|nr:PilN domain-containing protein [Erwinia sp.]